MITKLNIRKNRVLLILLGILAAVVIGYNATGTGLEEYSSGKLVPPSRSLSSSSNLASHIMGYSANSLLTLKTLTK
ncbi:MULTISPECIES: hypothetical protein [Reichenbachiella]|uniref:Uncharacterized protein n=1 Tax=Reichenbachiella agariperforans TaxID=156994 RepID=A0A1M6W347_REIAG|nr:MULTISPECIES: hypothetical protein [Reichenbachiella]MBU2915218.1 hypothetical protein [Reichenbachiella agariperforans]SHK88170.1 hypothetical protein SAMN04488028_110106 [Reichenbachiella agariperforans]